MATISWVKKIIGGKEFRQMQVNELANLSLIHEPDVNLVYYKRSPDEEIDQCVKSLMMHSFKGINAMISRQTLDGVVMDHLNSVELETTGKIKIEKDIIEIASMFFKITGASSLRLILKVITDDACRKFHTDAYDLRLLCTYSGKGTEWINDRFVDRKQLRVGKNEDIIKDASKIRCMEPFEVAILKGEVPSRPKDKGIVHRSPPLQNIGEKRLLLRLDY